MIRKLLNPHTASPGIDWALFVLRIFTGTFMITHGWGKMLRLFGSEPITFADPIGVGEPASLALTVFAEVFCSLLIIFGLGTRIASCFLFITMLVAALIVHSGQGFGKQELALLYSTVYAVLMISGSGRISIDNLIFKRGVVKSL